MSETPAREREIAVGAISEMLKRHKQQGHSARAILECMFDESRKGLEILIGGERIGEIHRNLGDAATLRDTRPALDLATPTPDDARIYVAQLLDDAPAALDRNSVLCAAVVHGATSLAARRGAAEVMAVLSDLFAQIKAGALARQIRSGDPAHDYN